MENKRYVKQVMILNKERHQEYLKDLFEEYLNFEGFVNFMLGSLYDEDRFVEQVIPNADHSQVLIVYKIKI